MISIFPDSIFEKSRISFINDKDFYKYSHDYIYKIINEAAKDKKNIILDQFLLPFNLFRIDNYFNEVSKVYNYEVKSVPKFSENVELINEYIRKQLYNNKTIIIAINNRQIKSFVKYLDSPYVITEENDIFDNKINIINFSMTEGLM